MSRERLDRYRKRQDVVLDDKRSKLEVIYGLVAIVIAALFIFWVMAAMRGYEKDVQTAYIAVIDGQCATIKAPGCQLVLPKIPSKNDLPQVAISQRSVDRFTVSFSGGTVTLPVKLHRIGAKKSVNLIIALDRQGIVTKSSRLIAFGSRDTVAVTVVLSSDGTITVR